MTTPETTEEKARAATKPVRIIFAFALLAIVGLGLIMNVVDWLAPDVAGTLAEEERYLFAGRSDLAFSGFVSAFDAILLVVAVLIATHIAPALKQSRLVTLIALIELGLMAVLGLVTFIFGTMYQFSEYDRQKGSEYQSLLLPEVITNIFVRLLSLALLGLAVFFVVKVFLADRPAPAPATQYGYGAQGYPAQQQQQPYGQQAYQQQGYDQQQAYAVQQAQQQAAQQQQQAAYAQQQAAAQQQQQQAQAYPQGSYGQQTSGAGYGAQATGQQAQQSGSYASSPYAAYGTPATPTSAVPGTSPTSAPPAATPTSGAPTSGSPATAPTSGAAASPAWPSTPTGAAQTWPPTPTAPTTAPGAPSTSSTDDAQRTQLITPEMRQQMVRRNEEPPAEGDQQQQPPQPPQSWS